MTQWNDVYKSGFRIDTKEPSKIVKLGLQHMPYYSKILDVGCGNGRNSIYAASLGHEVHAVDLTDSTLLTSNSPEIDNNINFHEKSIWDFQVGKGIYQGIIMTRIIQYFSSDELPKLFKHTLIGLSPLGLLMLNYIASGGTPQEVLKVNKFQHKVEDIVNLLNDEDVKILYLEEGDNVTTHLPYSLPAETYEILATR
jgi:2-polyprenyl-3-methyl-5-hydroxy-6-metoxy-1,4-benzoquinol methylase